MVEIAEERFEFTAKAKKNLAITGVAGVVLTIIGVIIAMSAGSGHDEHAFANQATEMVASTSNVVATAAEGEHHGSPGWLKRLYTSIWINNVYFTGFAIIGVFFFALQYAAQAGWSAGIKRIPEAFGYWLPFAGILMLAFFFISGGDLFHWTHSDLYVEGSATFDSIINGKKAFFFWPLHETPGFPIFWVVRLVVFFAIWYWLFIKMRALSLREDIDGGTEKWYKMRSLSAIFLVIFAVTSSVAAWDWVMSIDTHWFSTMFGWYVFASWFVAGLAFFTLITVVLKENGYLSIVNANHLHDLGKFLFAFSIFWTYIWFSQFLLIYYANIPEETVYFIERLQTGTYAPFFYLNIILNFFAPFLLLMTRDAKRHMTFLKLVAIVILVGHWLDFWLMITPGVMNFDGAIGFMEIGVTMIFLAAFLFVVLGKLSKAPLVAAKNPMLSESLEHHI